MPFVNIKITSEGATSAAKAKLNAALGRTIASPAAAFAGLAFADFANIDIPADLASLRAWRARVAERPSIAQAC